jgi:hypothetical protein
MPGSAGLNHSLPHRWLRSRRGPTASQPTLAPEEWGRFSAALTECTPGRDLTFGMAHGLASRVCHHQEGLAVISRKPSDLDRLRGRRLADHRSGVLAMIPRVFPSPSLITSNLSNRPVCSIRRSTNPPWPRPTSNRSQEPGRR